MKRKNLIIGSFFIYLMVVVTCTWGFAKDSITGKNLTAMCLQSGIPIVGFEGEKTEHDINPQIISKEKTTQPEATSHKTKKRYNGKPRVLIFHTHATESYLPSSSGNYHTIKEKNTVRDAGNVLAETLEANGIAVIHNKTLHDNPSYNASYYRSYETVEYILKKYPTIECVIDLHRDATAAKVDGPTYNVQGKKCAVYSYVTGNLASSYASNKAFIRRLNSVAASKYGNFTGEVLGRPYRYNQDLCSKFLLVEMGNNRNDIEEVRQTARIFGRILAKVLK